MQSFTHINRKTKGQSSFLICANKYPRARGQKGHCSLRNGLTSKLSGHLVAFISLRQCYLLTFYSTIICHLQKKVVSSE